ncbi:MAG: enoyl-CoA hydratase/isomerase family protein [Sphingomonadaceae bacterium]
MSSDVITTVEGRVGRIRLNRPQAIHALTTQMCAEMIDALIAWRDDEDVVAVLIDHAEGRGFCAGGDVVMLQKSGKADGRRAAEFFHTEYRLNHLLFVYPKPIAAFMDGITMGGGVGISQPAKFRIATENTRFAMPETAIGLFPDVGGGWYLSRLPGRMGQYLALTGVRLDGAACKYLGLATHYVAQDKLDELKQRMAESPDRIEGMLGAAGESPPPPKIEEHFRDIQRCFASDRFEEVLSALEQEEDDWAQKELAALRTKSPQACKVSLRLLAEGAHRTSFAEEMAQEYAVACRVVRRHDFAEGVRAVLIDKDNEPRWDPATPEGVTEAMLDEIFAPLPASERWTPVD